MSGFVVWLIILAVIVANGWNTAMWIYLAVSALLLISAFSQGKRNQSAGTETGDYSDKRIDRPHYIDPDDHECPGCGARFRQNTMVCPECGKKFSGTTENDDEFTEEMVLWDDDD